MSFNNETGNQHQNNPFAEAPQPAAAQTPATQPYNAPAYAQQPAQIVVQAPKSKIIAAVLAFFLGTLGVHNYYLGYNWRGLAQLGLLIISWLTVFFIIGWVGLAILYLWIFADIIQILCGVGGYKTDRQGLPLN
ncbi:TM2 domain-containing protein [Corynebacterium renale]|uniref:TM2 domain-containing membrane protein YozV n=1 Tax=Corynebacterium renale TaxID=1724 RepID=A0A2A9DQ79_9CORY|nr:TM2 domain-containing protein [Corynebacterium renale]PFG28132.1 TM2 domain-containing membrane protein YozV [Corynebacterium renale]SQI20406.1 TM2 domain [Corynebacterium renale]